MGQESSEGWDGAAAAVVKALEHMYMNAIPILLEIQVAQMVVFEDSMDLRPGTGVT